MANRSPANSAGLSRVVAVDLGSRFVRVVEVEQVGDETKMVRRATAALPLNCWNDVAANCDAMAASIREALSAAGISTKSVVACLPRRLVTVRFARLPQAPPEQIRGMIEFEAQQYILFPLNEVILDYHVPEGIGTGLSARQDDMQTVLLAAARRSLVANIVTIFDKVGVELSRLSVSALALAEHVRHSLEPTAVIALESGAMDVSVVADGQLLFTRSSAIEVAGIAREVAAHRFSEEVARSFTAYQNEFRQKPLAHVFLCGSETATAEGDWMDHALIEALEKPVARLHSRLLPAGDPEAPSYAIAAGMALQSLGGALSDINLVPNERAEKRLHTQQTRRNQLIGVGTAACIAVGLFFAHSALDAQEKQRVETIKANKDMDEAVKLEKPIQRSHDKVAVMDRVLTKALDRDHPSVDVLVAINRCMPKSTDIWLAQMNFDRGGLITLRGDSKNSRAVTDLMLNLQASGAFSDVRLSYIADAQDSANPADVVRVEPPKPAVTPLPGLQPTVTTAPAGVAPAGAAMGASPNLVNGGNSGGNTGASQFGGGGNRFNQGGGFNLGGTGGGAVSTGGFNGAGGFRGGLNRGASGGFNPGGGGFNPGAGAGANPGGVTSNSGANPSAADIQAAIAAYQAARAGAGQGQTAPLTQPNVPTTTGIQTLTAPLAVPPTPGPLSAITGGGQRMVITPDMGGGTPLQPGAPGQPGFNAAAANAWRQYRNGVTGGVVTSSVNMTGSVPGAVPQPVMPAVTTTTKRTVTTRKTGPVAQANKPTLTGFVITCRLRPSAKLIPPDARDTAQNSGTAERVGQAARATVIHGATDNSDDTGDIE